MKGYIYKHHWGSLLLATMLLASCADDTGSTDGDVDDLQLVAYSQVMTDISEVTTRAVPSGYSEYTGPEHIRVYMTQAGKNKHDGTFYYDDADGKWNSLVSVRPGVEYYIYGYMPAGAANCDISVLGEGSDYPMGARLTFTGIPPVSENDICIIKGVQDMTDDSAEINLNAGTFKYQGKEKGSNFVSLMLDHIFAAVHFRLMVDETYNQLRTIKLKKLALVDADPYTYEAAFDLSTTTSSTASIWTKKASMGKEWEGMTLFTSDDGSMLSTESPIEAEGYFIPIADLRDNLSILSIYDVYDKKGNLVRKDCKASNKLPKQVSASAGYRATLTLTVNPTYLYVLSEPDLDNPSVTLNIEH